MGIPSPKAAATDPSSGGGAAEDLARAVVRCRELASFLESVAGKLPERSQAPFLHSQLDETLRRLQASLRPFLDEGSPAAEKPVGFLRRLTQKRSGERRARNEVRYDLEGNSLSIPVTEVVGFLSQSGKSGLLWVTTPGETFVLEFARGSLVHATSNAPPAALRLGEILLRERLLAPEELTELIQKAKAADELLGSFLVHSGRLAHADLQRAMTIQVQQLFHRLMDAENSLFRFQEGAKLIRSHGLEVNITQLLLESARCKDEERQRRERAEGESGEPALTVLDLGEAADQEDPGPAPALPREGSGAEEGPNGEVQRAAEVLASGAKGLDESRRLSGEPVPTPASTDPG